MNYSKIILPSLIIALFYFVLVTLLMNSSLVKNTFLGDYGIEYKIKIIVGLTYGMWTSMSGIGLFLLTTTAILTGINLSLLSQKIKDLKAQGNLRIIVGGSSLFGIIGSGCAACGLPILALLGLSGSIAYLPLRGMELSYLSVLLLSLSFYLLIKQNRVNNCNINI
ncbi:MAG: hypothetical protein ACD_19C00017G0018 [uncultured bacterium]|nr:MAG: hypothetical protein ACD_19C00017G0018 [uncultured bacterium]